MGALSVGARTGTLALVTGAASGIGRAVCERLIGGGATVLAADLDADKLELLRSDLGSALVPTPCDVTSEAALTEVFGSTSALGGLDVVVANAGRGSFGMIADHDAAEFRSVIDLCLTGVFLTIKAATAVMNDGGSIVAISSLNARQPSAGMSAYCAAKAGVEMLVKVAAMELGPRGIRVNAVAPGLVQTPATAAFWAVPGVVDEFVENTTLGRFAQPSEIADVVAFLTGTDASFITGASFAVDGGAATKRYPDLPAAFSRFAHADPEHS